MSESEKKGIWYYIELIGNHFGTEIVVLFSFIFIIKAIDNNLIPVIIYGILINGTFFLIFGIIVINVVLIMYKKIKTTVLEVKLNQNAHPELENRKSDPLAQENRTNPENQNGD